MLLTVSLLCIVTFIAGLIDSIAGGGGLLRLPALLIAGVSPQQALGTNKFTGAIGTGAAMLNFARKGLILWKLAFIGIPCALLGSAAGSKCILAFDPQTAGKILIALLPVAAMITLIPRRSKSCKDSFTSKDVYLLTPLICFSVGFYDGFFGPGAGSFFIIAFNVCLRMNLIQASALTKVFNLSSNLGSLFVFLYHGDVLFLYAIPMTVADVLGNLHPHRPDHRSPLPAPLACHFVRFPYLEVLFRGVREKRELEGGRGDFLQKVPSSPPRFFHPAQKSSAPEEETGRCRGRRRIQFL